MARGRTEADNRASLLKARARKLHNKQLYPRKTWAELRLEGIRATAEERRSALRQAERGAYYRDIASTLRDQVTALLTSGYDDVTVENWSILAARVLGQVNAALQQKEEQARFRPQPDRRYGGGYGTYGGSSYGY